MADGHLGLGGLRPRARAAAGRGPLAPPRADDDDARGATRRHEESARGAARLLPLPRLAAHGALGRARVARPSPTAGPGRRDARPQRPAARPLGGHRRRLGRAGLRGRGASLAPPSAIVREGRLRPGDCSSSTSRPGRVLRPSARRSSRSPGAGPTARGTPSTRCTLADLPERTAPPAAERAASSARQLVFGYTQEDLRVLIGADGRTTGSSRSARWATTPPSRCSPTASPPLFSYFKQRSPRSPIPPIDSVREQMVMSLDDPRRAEAQPARGDPRAGRQLRARPAGAADDELGRLARGPTQPAVRSLHARHHVADRPKAPTASPRPSSGSAARPTRRSPTGRRS